MPFFASMEGSYGYGRSSVDDPPSTTFPYITNINTTNAKTLSDNDQGLWVFAQVSNTAAPVNLYDTRGGLRMSFTPTSGTTNYCLAYFSTIRPYSNIWIAKLVSNLSTPSVLLDKFNNLVVTFLASTGVLFYDKNNSLIGSYGANALASLYTLKLSTTGIYNGTTDPNTWIASSWLTVGTINMTITYSNPYNMSVDSEGNVITLYNFQKNISSPSTILQTLAKDGTVIRGIPLASGAINPMLIVIKYAYDGSALNSWVGYISTSASFGTLRMFWNTLKTNSLNQIILAVYTEAISDIQARDGTVNNNGSAPTFPAGQNVCIIRFSSDGTASTSWRTVILALSSVKSITPYQITIDNEDNILLTGFSEGQDDIYSYTIYAYNLSDSQVANVDCGISNIISVMYIVKYTNSGTPVWVSSLRTTGTSASTYINGANNGGQYNTNMRIAVDSSNSIIISGEYGNSTLSLFKAANTHVGTIVTPTTASDLFIITLSSDALTGYIARIGRRTTGATTKIDSLLIDSLGNIIIGGVYLDSPCGFFISGNDTTPAATATTLNTSCRNLFISRYSPTLSSVSIGYIREGNTGTNNINIIISQMVLDSSGNVIVAATCNSLNTPLQMFYDGTNSISRSALATVNDYTSIILAKFTFSSTGYWITRAYIQNTQNTSLVQAPLLNLLPNNTVRLFTFGTGSTITRFTIRNNADSSTNFTIIPANTPFALPYYINNSGGITYV